MTNFSSGNITILFKNLCCSHCKNDFSIDSLKIIKKFNNTYICNLTCQKCGKDFGETILKLNKNTNTVTPLQYKEKYEPIDYDDIIMAHKYIKNNL